MKVNLIFNSHFLYLVISTIGYIILRTDNCLAPVDLIRGSIYCGLFGILNSASVRGRLWTVDCGPGEKCRLKTESKKQAGGKMQNEISRQHWGKMRETTSRK